MARPLPEATSASIAVQVNGGWRQVPLEHDDHEPPVRAKAQDVEPVAEGLAGCRLPLVELARDYSYP